MKKTVVLVAFCVAFHATLHAQADSAQFALIPYPVSLVPGHGNYIINAGIGVGSDAAYSNERQFLQNLFRQYFDKAATDHYQDIQLRTDLTITEPEGYKLSVTGRGIVLSARTPAGMFYAIQTLRQLMPAAIENGHGVALSVPCVEIIDHPAFPWRGMMLDVSRHFFSTAYVKKFIDRMAFYKFNKLHLHLTDDQGWRIEIKKYPRLTEESAWRSFNDQDSACIKLAKDSVNPDFNIDPTHIRTTPNGPRYGGFYTQAELKDIISYADSRHIEIIPEIDMPGHMMAAILLYPWLTAEGNTGADWRNGFTSPICPCKDSVLNFAKDIFGELADLFPSHYIHIGGDEVEKSHWKDAPVCKQFMAGHGIANVDQLQGYFNREMQAFFRSRGKTLVGWDEIVDGGIDSSAVVMFWRTWAKLAPSHAASNGNKVVMSADGPLYFDAWPDASSLSKVYHYNPFDTAYHLTAAQHANIIGLQANLWTERVPSEARADYLLYPRMMALAELAWTHRDLYEDFLRRLQAAKNPDLSRGNNLIK